MIIKKLGGNLSFFQGIYIIFLSQLGRYIPGRVWVVTGRLYLGQKFGISPIINFTGGIYLDVISTFSGFLLGLVTGLTFILYKFESLIREYFYLFILFLIFLIFVIFFIVNPKILIKLINIGLIYLNKEPISYQLKLVDTIFLFILSNISWFIFGFSFFLFANSIEKTSYSNIFLFISSFSLSVLFGFISLITPGGVGVREGALTYFLKYCYSSHIALLISLLGRVWSMIGDLISIGIAGIIYLKKIKS